MHPEKSPGADGFNAGFFQKIWSLLAAHVTEAVQHFFSTGKLLKGCKPHLCYFNPKFTNASHFNDFRPISCCNVQYELITKVLSNRLKVVAGELVSPHQYAFLEGRQINDCSLRLISKKAFHSLNREFIYFIMNYMRSPPTWISWIKECLSTPTFSMMVNDYPSLDSLEAIEE